MVRSHLTGAGSNASKKREQLENSVCHNSGATISIVDVHCFRFRGPSSSSSKRGETKIMHRPKPTNDKAETSLARLAEIADAEFRRRVFCGSTGLLHPKSASTSMRKRSSSSDGDDEEERSSASTKKKKIRKNHGDEDDDGNDKMMQFRQVSRCLPCLRKACRMPNQFRSRHQTFESDSLVVFSHWLFAFRSTKQRNGETNLKTFSNSGRSLVTVTFHTTTNRTCHWPNGSSASAISTN